MVCPKLRYKASSSSSDIAVLDLFKGPDSKMYYLEHKKPISFRLLDVCSITLTHTEIKIMTSLVLDVLQPS